MQLDRKDYQILVHIREYCKEVRLALESFPQGEDEFERNPVFRNACSMPIMQIGELAKHLSEEFVHADVETPWRAIKGMRNLFAHDYHSMNYDLIWETATENIPELELHIQKILKGMI
ncbi:MAG: DUF86 domain-containing protein [Selenomonas sp.]|nr:DUF86 domain-containing protein [Selenomonas sp.]